MIKINLYLIPTGQKFIIVKFYSINLNLCMYRQCPPEGTHMVPWLEHALTPATKKWGDNKGEHYLCGSIGGNPKAAYAGRVAQ